MAQPAYQSSHVNSGGVAREEVCLLFLILFASGKISQTAKVGRALIASSDELLFGSYNWDHSGLRSELFNVQGKNNPPHKTSFCKSGPSYKSLFLSIIEPEILRLLSSDQHRLNSSPM